MERLVTGYQHPAYIHSFIELGEPVALPESEGWILRRAISGTPYYDAMGSYPLFLCTNWHKLAHDLANIQNRIVSLAVVTDPFGSYAYKDLKRAFIDVVLPFKEHYVVDLDEAPKTFICKHHKRNAGKALKQLQIEQFHPSEANLKEWKHLYSQLIKKHTLKGALTFSESIFARQFEVPGLVAFQALWEGEPVSMLLWYRTGQVGYYHLGASTETGYRLGASFGLFWFAIHYFAETGLRWLSLGAGAGIDRMGTDGLSRFKRGWATGTRAAYFCGRIFDPQRYDKITKNRGIAETRYFPAYRVGEFV